MTKMENASCEAYRYSKLSREVLELAFMNLPTLNLASPRHLDPQVTEALVRCAAVIGSIAVSKLVDVIEVEDGIITDIEDEAPTSEPTQ